MTTTTYTTHDDDVLDRICYAYYGRENAIVGVYEANPGLAEYGVLLPAGIVIKLPELTEPTTQGTALWD
ncbi:tail protein X [Celerinatantimonas sp. YJH-8]|uniref:tail protein X n=1 Tax=Celerinatantimonas sp. YJH-8 TaxID=3228714 RepID=UPI0038C5C8FC